MAFYTWYCSGLLLGCTLNGRVVDGYEIYLHVLVVQRSLTVLRPSQAFHHVICGCRIMFAIFPTVAYRTCTEAGSRRGVNDTRRRHQLLVSLMDCRCKGIHRCGRYSVSLDHMLRKARGNLHLYPPKLGDPPPTSELLALLHHSLLLQLPSLRSCRL